MNDIYWTADQQRTIAEALGSARGGTATVLAVEGGAGFGKSTLLAEVCGHAEGFVVSTAFGMDTLQVPFDILAQWGVRQHPDAAQRPGNPFVAAQRLREFLDEQSLRGPVLWCLDDLDSADPQSVEALVWLLRRACGERLLIAATNQALPPGRHPGWRRLVDTPARDLSIRTLRLDGLEFADAARLIAARCPELRTEAARRLWQHTDGNPLYLRSLMSEYDPVALTRDPQLPAPAEFAQVIAARLERLDDAALALCEALAVLGPEWVSVPDAVAVAGLEDPGDAARHLVRADLIESRRTDAAPQVRIRHRLTLAAVYQQTASARRRRFHLAAAAVVTDRSAALEHRFLATEHHDDGLANELAEHAWTLYDARRYRLAARFHGRAGTVTASPAVRHERWIEALFCNALSGDHAAVAAQTDALTRSGDRIGRALVLGCLAVMESRLSDALRFLEDADEPLVDKRTEYRIQSLLSWARLLSGESAEAGRPRLQRIRALPIVDRGTAQYVEFGIGLALQSLEDLRRRIAEAGPVPSSPATAPLALTPVIAMRGVLNYRLGLMASAVEDFHEVTRRIEDGYNDFADSVMEALLGCAFWFLGRWNQADLYLRLAAEMSGDRVPPLIQTVLPLVAVGRGHFDEADRLLAETSAVLRHSPWHSGIQGLLVTQVVRLHAGGDEEARAAFWKGTVRQWPAATLYEGGIGPIYLAHLALAAIWASELGEARNAVELLSGHAEAAPWAAVSADWLSGLIAERKGDLETARVLLARAAAAELPDMPLYRAHILADHARVAGSAGRTAEEHEGRRAAHEIYRSLGAEPYLRRVRAEPGGGSGAGDYSDRERDILTLVLAGMSYAQIAKELYITRSTVGYHLSNMYAKAGVRSRHELAAQARARPEQFGLSTPR